MAVLVIVAVFAVKGDSRAREGFGYGEDFVQLRHFIFEGYPTCQGEIQVFRKPIVLKPAASQGRVARPCHILRPTSRETDGRRYLGGIPSSGHAKQGTLER